MGLLVLRRRMEKKADYLRFKWLLENFVTKKMVRVLLEPGPDGRLVVERVLDAYADTGDVPSLSGLRRAALLRFFRVAAEGLGMTEETLRESLRRPSIRRTIVNALQTIDRFGVSFPQRFYAPLMVVWNFTWACNLRCAHCYQNAGPLRPQGLTREELALDEKLALVDQMAEANIPTLSFSGGEPLIHPDFWPVAERARERGLYLSINTNGTLITEEVARRFEELDFAYVAVSVDAPEPGRHDRFRGVPGAWERTVTGIRHLARTRVSTVLSFTITRENYRQLPAMYRLAEELGMDKVMVYNFIPTGRAREIVEQDLTPEMREEALQMMYEYAAGGGSLCSTAPQLGRLCLERGRPDLVPLAHTGPGRARELGVLAHLIGGCGVGRAYLALQPDGRVTPCVYMPDITLGHVREKPLLAIWHTNALLPYLAERRDLKGHCGVCDYREVCGGCRARAYAYFGDFKAPDPGCINNREAYRSYWQERAVGAIAT
ncbi:MAG: radical SAM protein [Desulfotomaculales bacterium]